MHTHTITHTHAGARVIDLWTTSYAYFRTAERDKRPRRAARVLQSGAPASGASAERGDLDTTLLEPY